SVGPLERSPKTTYQDSWAKSSPPRKTVGPDPNLLAGTALVVQTHCQQAHHHSSSCFRYHEAHLLRCRQELDRDWHPPLQSDVRFDAPPSHWAECVDRSFDC